MSSDKREMRMKENAPSLARPTSPERKYKRTLADIPEAIPGPNAFAQQAARSEKHRLDGNAFYQQEVQRRTATPPTAIHPALRTRSVSDPPTPPRDSLSTTMSPFVNMDRESREPSPPLKLVPNNAHLAEPTLRGIIEERHERMQYPATHTHDQRTPVFVHTPSPTRSEFLSSAKTPKKRGQKEDSSVEPSSKTPKKGFLDKFKITGKSSTPSTTKLTSLGDSQPEIKMPPKAKQVLGKSPPKERPSLGTSPSKISIPRSPSKRKHFFSRKASNIAMSDQSNAAVVHQSPEIAEPTTAISDPTHYSFQHTGITSQSKSNQDAEKANGITLNAITRSQSLKYFDHSIPPTPPAKNTPPNEKVKRDVVPVKQSSRLPFHDDPSTLAREECSLFSTSDHASPIKFGSYAHREAPTLVTRPSIYSLHASVVPNLTEANTFEEMKARLDGLGLEGFNMPPENVRSSKHEQFYSPSMYSSDWIPRPASALAGSVPTPDAVARESNGVSMHTQGSSSSGGEIAIYYPGLSKDPSIGNLTAAQNYNASPINNDQHQSRKRPGTQQSTAATQVHSCNQTRTSRQSADSSLFAVWPGGKQDDSTCGSPTSFDHPSATPSPLHLHPTVYTPPPRRSSKPQAVQLQTQGKPVATDKTEVAGLGVHNVENSTSTPSKYSNNVFDNAPSFPADAQSNASRTPSPQNSPQDRCLEPAVDVDPQKISPVKAKSPATEKLDRMIDMLNRLQDRNSEINEMRNEMRATNVRLGQRLAMVENLHQTGKTPTPTKTTGLAGEARDSASSRENRVPTSSAHDFYRQARASENSAGQDASDSKQMNNSTIAELKETNKRLLEMVGGFADKIRELEEKVGG